jgi:hypothetical protein
MASSLLKRSTLDNALAVGGVVVILLQVLFMAYTRTQVAIVLAGILVNQVGVWGVASRMMPERRLYLPLRREVRHFIDMVRELNDVALIEAGGVDGVRRRMHESVDRMVGVAGEVGSA